MKILNIIFFAFISAINASAQWTVSGVAGDTFKNSNDADEISKIWFHCGILDKNANLVISLRNWSAGITGKKLIDFIDTEIIPSSMIRTGGMDSVHISFPRDQADFIDIIIDKINDYEKFEPESIVAEMKSKFHGLLDRSNQNKRQLDDCEKRRQEERAARDPKIIKAEEEHQQAIMSYFPPTLNGLEIGAMYAGYKMPYQGRLLEAKAGPFSFTCPSYIDHAVLQCVFDLSDLFGSISATYKIIKVSGEEDDRPLHVDIVDEKARQAFKRFNDFSGMIDIGRCDMHFNKLNWLK